MKKENQIDKRIIRSRDSVLSAQKLLDEIISDPMLHIDDECLLRSLKSQGAFAKYKNEKIGIYPTSINTIKRISDEYVDGGYEYFDSLRIMAHKKVSSYKSNLDDFPKKRNTSLKEKVDHLENVNELLRQDLLIVTKICTMLFDNSVRYASLVSSDEHSKCIKENRVLMAMLSIRKTSVGNNVRSINEKGS